VAPIVSLTASAGMVSAGSAFQLNWTSSNDASCTGAVVGVPSSTDGWSGQKTVSGSQTITETASGTYQYSLSCADANNLASAGADVTVTVTASNSGGSSGGGSGGGGGGGGGVDFRLLLVLLLGALRKLWRAESLRNCGVYRAAANCEPAQI
jgi:hypothetical protein